MWADQDKSGGICTPKYLIQVTFSIMAKGEPIKSWGKLEARLDIHRKKLQITMIVIPNFSLVLQPL